MRALAPQRHAFDDDVGLERLVRLLRAADAVGEVRPALAEGVGDRALEVVALAALRSAHGRSLGLAVHHSWMPWNS